MTDDRIDLSSLDPTRDPERFGRIVRAISIGAAGELAARRARSSVIGQVGLWWRPLFAAAAIAGVISLLALSKFGGSISSAETEFGIAEAIGVPEALADWVGSEETPTTADLLLSLEAEG